MRAQLRTALPIVVGAAFMLSFSMGIRQTWGLFLQPMSKDMGISVAHFTFALALQNLAWGLFQPFTGALVVRCGFRLILMSGAILYVLGLGIVAVAGGPIAIGIGSGLFVGAALACTASAMAQAAVSRAVPPTVRSTVLGIITGLGTLGALVAAPIAQAFTIASGWRAGILAIMGLALVILPAAWFAGRVDAIPIPQNEGIKNTTLKGAVANAFSNDAFLVMTLAYFVCGMQLLFISTHLPSYLAICGMDPMLSAEALSVIAATNFFGSVFFGWAGGRRSKLVLLGGIYTSRSLVMAAYFAFPPTPTSTLVFAAFAGFLWLGVGPLISGAVVEMFGLKWQAMIQGLAFTSHQLGSFAGAFGGGILFDFGGSYDLAWRLAVSLGLTAGIIQMAYASFRPVQSALG
ncbi:putative MFS family arabinose efflux permease [Bradyrhizobium sp. USDA 4461]